jgi:predicted enzyme related to lactoylglutathione lyase
MSTESLPSRGRVLGLGGLFFKSRDPRALSAWYAEHLGFPVAEWGGAVFRNADDPNPAACAVWSPFAADTTYFEPGAHAFMLNLRVEHLDALIERLRSSGCRVLDRSEDSDLGRFRYVLDPEDHLLELWEPKA